MGKATIITTAIGLALTAGLGVGLPVAAAGSGGDGALVSQERIDQRGPYPFTVRGVGSFEIRKIQPRRATEQPCSVHVPSLEQYITAGRRSGALELEVGKVFNGKLALSECINDAGKAVPCCKGHGEICTVNIAVTQLF